MQITIVGSGNVGRALARRFTSVGHEVRLARRAPSESSPVEGVPVVGLAGAGATPVVVLATPATAVAEVVPQLGVRAGAVVVDATNPFGLPDGASTVEAIQSAAPDAAVVKAFHTVGAEVLADPDLGGRSPVLTVCGDDADAVERIVALADGAGFEPVVLGGLAQVPTAEAFARLWVTLSRGPLGRGFAFGLLRR